MVMSHDGYFIIISRKFEYVQINYLNLLVIRLYSYILRVPEQEPETNLRHETHELEGYNFTVDGKMVGYAEKVKWEKRSS